MTFDILIKFFNSNFASGLAGAILGAILSAVATFIAMQRQISATERSQKLQSLEQRKIRWQSVLVEIRENKRILEKQEEAGGFHARITMTREAWQTCQGWIPDLPKESSDSLVEIYSILRKYNEIIIAARFSSMGETGRFDGAIARLAKNLEDKLRIGEQLLASALGQM